MEGEGVLHTANGERYKGHFQKGLKHGRCIEIQTDGTRFEGSYSEGERNGDFIEYDRNGNKIAAGTYEHGRRVETYKR